MEGTVRWNIAVSPETDRALRMLLASRGGGRKGDLSRFIEEAVRQRVVAEIAAAAKEQNAGRSSAEIEAAVDEALDWARQTP